MTEELTVEQKTIKLCSHCKTIQEFYKNAIWCKSCTKEKSRKWHYKNKQRSLEYAKQWALANPGKILATKRKYRESHRDEAHEYQKKRRTENPERERKRKSEWNHKNQDRVRALARIVQAKERSTPRGMLNHRMSVSIRETLKGTKNGKKWQELAGYTLEELKKHFEKQFIFGMSWENMGIWHIDHVIPIAAFNFTKPDDIDFKRCWAIKNLRPLWREDNAIKHNKLSRPFQPALAIGI